MKKKSLIAAICVLIFALAAITSCSALDMINKIIVSISGDGNKSAHMKVTGAIFGKDDAGDFTVKIGDMVTAKGETGDEIVLEFSEYIRVGTEVQVFVGIKTLEGTPVYKKIVSEPFTIEEGINVPVFSGQWETVNAEDANW